MLEELNLPLLKFDECCKTQRLNATKGLIYKTTRGKNGGTWVHWQIASAYATRTCTVTTHLRLPVLKPWGW
jgi:hypothetical protein